MKNKNLPLLALLVVTSLAAYVFLSNAQTAEEAGRVVEDISTQIRTVAEPAPSPDVHVVKAVIKAFTNLLPAS